MNNPIKSVSKSTLSTLLKIEDIAIDIADIFNESTIQVGEIKASQIAERLGSSISGRMENQEVKKAFIAALSK